MHRSAEVGGDQGANGAHYVYVYRFPNGKPAYVGYGKSVDRAQGHQESSHNAALETLIATEKYLLEIAGPFRDVQEGLNVESALISALKPKLNVAPGNGTRLRPFGVPAELASRFSMPPLDESEIGLQANGALLVYLASGQFMADGRRKFDPANPDTEILAQDCEAWWQLGRHEDAWKRQEIDPPSTLVAVYGPKPEARFIIGAFDIEWSRFRRDDDVDRGLWKVPLKNRGDADACELRGRRIHRIAFGRYRHEQYHLVSPTGQLIWNGHPPKASQ